MDWTKALPAAVGALGFLLSLYNLWRSAKTAREVRSLAYAQRKQEVFAAILTGEASYLNAKIQAQDLRDEAEDSKAIQAQDAVKQANFLIDECNRALALLKESRDALGAAASKGKSHDDLVYLVEEHAAAVSEFTNKSKIEAEAAALLQPARRLLKLIRAAKRSP